MSTNEDHNILSALILEIIYTVVPVDVVLKYIDMLIIKSGQGFLD